MFAAIAATLTVVIVLICLSSSTRARRISVLGKSVYLQSVLTLFGYGLVLALVVISCILIAQIPKEDGGIGLIKAGAAPILILVFSLGSLVAAAVCAFVRHMLENIYPALATITDDPKTKENFAAWAKVHKKLLMAGSVVLVVIIGLSVGISLAILNRHNGTYYLYQNGEYNYEKYFILKGNTYTDETGYSCDVKFSGNNIKMYAETLGIKDVVAEGTIKDDVLRLEIMGVEVTYAKKGHKHKLQDEVIKEATCEEEGSSILSCYCGYREEPKTLPALGHEFDENHLCKRCGVESGVLLEFALNEEETEYCVKSVGACTDNVIMIPNHYKGLPVTSIGIEAFYYCSRLTSIVIPDNVTSIGNYAFYGCSGLTTVTIPGNVTSIGSYAFYGCSGLTEIKVDENNKAYHSQGNCLIETQSKTLIAGCNTSKIPDDGSVTIIDDYAFFACYGLTSITIPDSVTEIGNYAFKYCTGLTSVTIGSGVTSIIYEAFEGCSGLQSVIWNAENYNGTEDFIIPVFYDCSLSSLIFGEKVKTIPAFAFYGCSGLTEIKVDENNETYHSQGNCLIETQTKTLILGCKTSEIPDDGSVTIIGSYAFGGCSGLTSIVIPDSVTEIGRGAFAGCNELQSVVWNAENCAEAGDYIIPVFHDCTNLGNVTFGENVKTIPAYAFYGCSGLTSIVIPDSVTSIGSSAFYCSGLTSVTIGNSVTKIGSSAFAGCRGLTSIVIPDSVTSIGERAFYGCRGLTSVTIPDSVTSIGDYAFGECRGLTSVTIGNSVTKIGDGAFLWCSNLQEVHFENPNGWKANGTSLSGLDNAETAAKYLTDTYLYYYWKREG